MLAVAWSTVSPSTVISKYMPEAGMMRYRFRLLAAAALLPVMAQIAWGLEQRDDVAAAIEAVNRKFSAAFAQKDAAAMASRYSSDAVVLPPGGAAVRGRDGIEKIWRGAMAAGDTLTLATIDVESHGDYAHEVGTYVLKAGAKDVDRGNYVVVWKRQRGEWMLHRDIWNSSVPPGR